MVAAVVGAQQHLAPGIEHVAVVRRDDERRLPQPAMWRQVRGASRLDVRLVAEVLIDAGMATVLAGGVEPSAVGRVDLRHDAVAVA